MDLGSGVAVGTLCVSVGAVCITAIRSKSNGNGNGKTKQPYCQEHSGVCTSIENIEEMLKEVRTDIKHLLEKK